MAVTIKWTYRARALGVVVLLDLVTSPLIPFLVFSHEIISVFLDVVIQLLLPDRCIIFLIHIPSVQQPLFQKREVLVGMRDCKGEEMDIIQRTIKLFKECVGCDQHR